MSAHDAAEPISIRGDPALTQLPSQGVRFALQEGAFYGDVAPDPSASDWIACRGEYPAAGELAGTIDRDCVEPGSLAPTLTRRGFTRAGCADYWPVFPSPYALELIDRAALFCATCHDQPRIRRWQGAKAFEQIITGLIDDPP